jgi:hypothetical protein
MKIQKSRFLLTILALVGMTAVCGLQCTITPSRAQTAEEKHTDPTLSICPKCKGSMEPGVVLDYWALNSVNQTMWAPFCPTLNLLSKQPDKRKITSYRCASCGYLEEYAK